MSNCKAKRYNDQYICGRCALQWDVKDPEPPVCLPKSEIGIKKIRDIIKEMKHKG